jgi:soluble lytic murein transglycosylase-like protein
MTRFGGTRSSPGDVAAALLAVCLVVGPLCEGCATGRPGHAAPGPASGPATVSRSAARAPLGAVPGAPSGPLRAGSPLYPLAEPYLPQVLRSAARHGVDTRLILGVIMVESGFNARARSTSGALGLMQLLPETGRRFGASALQDPAQNIDAGTRYLRYLLDLFSGDLDRALAGYTAGEMAVVRARGVPGTPVVRRFVRNVKDRSRQF